MKYQISFRNKNQTRLNSNLKMRSLKVNKSKTKHVCLKKGEPSSKTKYNI